MLRSFQVTALVAIGFFIAIIAMAWSLLTNSYLMGF
jgi:hypothetical protein